MTNICHGSGSKIKGKGKLPPICKFNNPKENELKNLFSALYPIR